MSTRFRLLTESDVRAVLTLDDLVDAMVSALWQLSTGRVAQPLRTVIPVGPDARLFATMPAYGLEIAPYGARQLPSNPSAAVPLIATFARSIIDPREGALV